MIKLKNTDKIIVFDLESTCGRGVINTEIIEIGAVKIINKQVVGEFSVFIKPIKHPILTDFCIELTSITQEDVDGGVDILSALKWFKTWSEKDEVAGKTLFMSWGKYDKNKINETCEEYGVNSLFNQYEHFNLKGGYSNVIKVKKMGLRKAIERERLRWIGTEHRGVYDAYNAAQILAIYYDKILYN